MKNLSRSKNYKNAQVYGQREKLPVGAYELIINNVKFVDNSDKGYANQIVLAFDIASGDYKGFFKRDYENNQNEDKKWRGSYRFWEPMDDGSEKDSWAQSKLKTIIAAFEDSNSGFVWDWDEQKLKGLKVGAVFNEKEYSFNGKTGFFTNCHSLIPISGISTAKIPQPTLLKGSKASNSDFVDVTDSVEEEIPF